MPEGAKGRRLRLGKLEVSYPGEDAVEVRTSFAREMRVVLRRPPGVPAVRCDGRPVAARREGEAVVFAAPAGETCRRDAGPDPAPSRELVPR